MTNTSNPVYTQLYVIFVFILQSLKVRVVLSPFSSLSGAISWYCDFVLVLYFIGSGFWSMVSCCQTFSSFCLFPKILYSLGLNFGALVLFLFFFLIWLFFHCCIVLGPLDSGALTTRRSFPWLWQIQVDSRNHKYNTNTDSSRNHNAHFSVFNFLHHHHCHHFHKIMVITRSSQHLLWQQAKPLPSWAFN